MSVLDRLGAALCDVARSELPTGVSLRDGRCCLVVPNIEYDGLVDAMFDMIRQNAFGNAAVLIRLMEILTAVASCEHDPERVEALQRHSDLALGDAERNISTPGDLEDVRRRHAAFKSMRQHGPIGSTRDEPPL